MESTMWSGLYGPEATSGAMIIAMDLDFDSLVERHGARVFNLAFRVTGNRQDAEDVTQDTFIKVFKNLPSFRGDSDPATWIYRIALNASLKVKRKIGDEASLDALEERIDAMRDEVPDEVRRWFVDPSEAVLVGALLSEINQGCLHFMTFRLTDEQRVVYVMRVILDFSYAEISGVLGVSEEVVKSRLHRARAKLEKHFASRCQWLDPDHASCSCESRIGFALALDPEILRRVRAKALTSPEKATYVEHVARQVDSVSALYASIPALQYKAEAVKNYLRQLQEKAADP